MKGLSMDKKRRLIAFIGMIGMVLSLILFFVQTFAIRNLFDEMYYGSEDVYMGILTQTNWRYVKGLEGISDFVKYGNHEGKPDNPEQVSMVFSNAIMPKDEYLSVNWLLSSKILQFSYLWRVEEDGMIVRYIIHLNYSPNKKTLYIEPIQILMDGTYYDADDAFMNTHDSLTDNRYKALQMANAVIQEFAIDGWRLVNPFAMYSCELGKVQIINNSGIPVASEVICLH